jgi:hypothetical protein
VTCDFTNSISIIDVNSAVVCHTINISDFPKVGSPMLEVVAMEMRQNIGRINRTTQVPLLVTCVVLLINMSMKGQKLSEPRYSINWTHLSCKMDVQFTKFERYAHYLINMKVRTAQVSLLLRKRHKCRYCYENNTSAVTYTIQIIDTVYILKLIDINKQYLIFEHHFYIF